MTTSVRISEGNTAAGRSPDADIVDVIATLVPPLPSEGDAHLSGAAAQWLTRARVALECSGARVIEAPAKRQPDGAIKHSDDAVLMITVLATCLKIRPRFLRLIAVDGDFQPLVAALREEGVRTELFTTQKCAAPELKRAAYRVHFLEDWLRECCETRAVKLRTAA